MRTDFLRSHRLGLSLAALGLLAALLALGACKLTNGGGAADDDSDPPEVQLGERLFKDTRFGHYFTVESQGRVNAPLPEGESVVATTVTATRGDLIGPMRGQAVNCLQCHLVEQQVGVPGGGMRTYADFAPRSPMPVRAEDITHISGFTPRNAADMVDDVFHGDLPERVLHWDGEFGSMTDLVDATLTGRNYGWLPTEHDQAVHQIATVLRQDDGTGELAGEFGALPYYVVLGCKDKNIPVKYQLPAQYCMDVTSATDAQVEADVAALIASYVDSLTFFQDEAGQYNGSPYDQFLIDNGLPRSPAAGQDAHAYAANLLSAIQALPNPKFVDCCSQFNNGSHFAFHDQRPFSFGKQELRGLIAFLRTSQTPLTGAQVARGGIGNCAACHTPPAFNDFLMHNTGVSQAEYDKVHGQGSFMALTVPTLAQRDADPNAYLPVSPEHPDATETFRMAAVAADPDKADLGAWNIFANPDLPARKAPLRKFLCAISTHRFADCGASDATLLDASLGVFKTRSLRDLGDSDPYMHDGQFDTLEDAVKFYQQSSQLARAGKLRNGDPAIGNIALTDQDVLDMAAFLAALDEDYSN